MSHWRKRNPTAAQFNTSLRWSVGFFIVSGLWSRFRCTGTSENVNDAVQPGGSPAMK
jgi:hypothetical protein